MHTGLFLALIVAALAIPLVEMAQAVYRERKLAREMHERYKRNVSD